MSTKLTSEIVGYKETGSFRFWCQHVLPLVYDDSLSYYELLCKLVNYLNDLVQNVDDIYYQVQVLNQLKSYVNNYFSKLNVQDEINNKLDKMAEDGTLATILSKTRAYVSQEKGWVVRQIDNTYDCSIELLTTSELIDYIKKTDDNSTFIHLCKYMPPKSVMLPMPIIEGVVTGGSDSTLGVITEQYVTGHYAIVHYAGMFFQTDIESPNTALFHIRVVGRRPTVKADPLYPVSEKGAEAVAIARSYYNAKENGRHFAYGSNFITYANNNIVNNANGSAKMECDTLIALCMLGIPYEQSPYANDTPNYRFEFENLNFNPNNYSWVLPWEYNEIVRRKVTYTGLQCWYYWNNQLEFSNASKLATGDIAIFRTPNSSKYFDNIAHTGIIEIVDNVPWMYHVTDSNVTGSPLVFEPLQTFLQRKQGLYSSEDGTMYFARPNYDA